ncbi:uncharacterized protein LAESUDRAFT_728062, partial [Laetiporus sulphureus 93-53]
MPVYAHFLGCAARCEDIPKPPAYLKGKVMSENIAQAAFRSRRASRSTCVMNVCSFAWDPAGKWCGGDTRRYRNFRVGS